MCRDYANLQVAESKKRLHPIRRAGGLGKSIFNVEIGKRKLILSAHLGTIYKNTDMLYTKVINQCIGVLDCGSALAEAEVDYENKTSSGY